MEHPDAELRRIATKEVLASLAVGLDCFRYLPPSEHLWSAKEWVKNPTGWVFFTFRSTDKAAVLPILSLCMESLTRKLLAREIAPPRTIRVVIDELASLKALGTLPEFAGECRKYGISLVLGFQDILQIYPIYGEHVANSMMNQLEHPYFFRCNGPETQQWCAANIGKEEKLITRQSETVGSENGRDSITRSPQSKTDDVIMGAEFGQGENRQGGRRCGSWSHGGGYKTVCEVLWRCGCERSGGAGATPVRGERTRRWR